MHSSESYLRCSHPRLTWPIAASRLVASLQSKFAAGTAFFHSLYRSYLSLALSLMFIFSFDRLTFRHNRSCNPNLKVNRKISELLHMYSWLQLKFFISYQILNFTFKYTNYRQRNKIIMRSMIYAFTLLNE